MAAPWRTRYASFCGRAAEEAGREALDLINPPIPPAQPAPRQARTDAVVQKRVLLIIGGGIAAYKSLDLIRRLQDRGARVRCILTAAAAHFVTPLAAGALAGERAYTDLFDQQSEFDVGHIRMARETDLIVVRAGDRGSDREMASGQADDLATAVLLATNKPIMLAPAMNPHMWAAKATQRNLAQLRVDGVQFIGPNAGEMAERGEAGIGRMAEPLEIAAAADALLRSEDLSSPANASWSHPGRPANRSIRCACSPIVRRASKATPLRRQPRRPAPT